MENNSIDKTRQDKTRQDKTRQDKTRQSNETNYPCQDMPKRIGNLYGDDRGTGFAGNVWNKNAISPTITTCQGGGREPMILDSFIVAMRGRNPEKPNDRTPGLPTEQRLEMAQEGMTSTLTTVQKDNLVLEQYGEIESLNPEKDGTCRTIKAQYFKNSTANFIRQDSLGATGVVKIKQATKEGSIKCKVGGCYDASYPYSKTRRGRVQEGGDITPTITAQGGENINYVEGVENEIERKTNLLQILRERVEEETFCEWAIRGLLCILQTEILRQNVYAKSIFKSWEKSPDLEQFTHDSKGNQSIITDKEQLRDMWEKWALRCTPYRQQLSEQQYRELESFVQKLSHENTSFHVFMFCLWEAGEGIWVLRKALSEIQEIWKPTSDKQRAWSYRIRKLTPREVWRLMGYTDTDFDKASAVNSNTQLYKQAGNAIVKQVLMAIFSQMNIKGVKPWNDMTLEEKYNLIRKSTSEKKLKNN